MFRDRRGIRRSPPNEPTRASRFRVRAIGLLVLLFVHTPSTSPATTIRVPEDVATIWQASDKAASGDSIVVGPGTWSATTTRSAESLHSSGYITSCGFIKGGVTILSSAGSQATIIEPVPDGTENSRVVGIVYLNQTQPSKIVGFTFRGSSSQLTSAVLAVDGTLMRSLAIEGCEFTAFASYAVLSLYSTLLVTDCEFRESGDTLGGVALRGGIVTVRDSRFIQLDGVGISVHEAVVEISNCLFLENGSDESLNLRGGGIFASDSHGVIERCVFSGNLGYGAAAIQIEESHSNQGWTIRENTFSDNANSGKDRFGGAVFVEDALVSVERNTFVRNVGIQGANVLAYNSSIALLGNVFAFSVGPSSIELAGSDLLEEWSGCNLFWGNESESLITPTDFIQDPLFCDPETYELFVRSNSPCVAGNRPGCGSIGAWGIGCGAVSIRSESWGRIKSLYR